MAALDVATQDSGDEIVHVRMKLEQTLRTDVHGVVVGQAEISASLPRHLPFGAIVVREGRKVAQKE
jgi:hypothetical protein